MHHIISFMENNDASLNCDIPTMKFIDHNCFIQSRRSMLTSCQPPPQASTPNTPPIQATYQYVESQLKVHEYFNLLLKMEPAYPKENKLIQSKMRGKLFNWLQKLALETFNFSKYTLLTAGIIIDQYLEKTNEAPSALQLIGCAGLLLASKLREETIVDPDCYSTASCNVFTRRQLLERERAMYQCIDWKKVKTGVISGIRLGCILLNMKDRLEQCEGILWNCLKDEELMGWRQVKLVYGALSIASMDPLEELAVKDSLNLIRLI